MRNTQKRQTDAGQNEINRSGAWQSGCRKVSGYEFLFCLLLDEDYVSCLSVSAAGQSFICTQIRVPAQGKQRWHCYDSWHNKTDNTLMWLDYYGAITIANSSALCVIARWRAKIWIKLLLVKRPVFRRNKRCKGTSESEKVSGREFTGLYERPTQDVGGARRWLIAVVRKRLIWRQCWQEFALSWDLLVGISRATSGADFTAEATDRGTNAAEGPHRSDKLLKTCMTNVRKHVTPPPPFFSA